MFIDERTSKVYIIFSGLMALQSHSLIKEQERYPVCLCDSMFQWPISCDQCCKNREGIILVAGSFETGVDVDLHQE